MNDKKTEAFGRLLDVMDELREKCPWDRVQTIESLRNCTIEETYELVEAITEGDFDGMRQELGDLMLHVVFYSKIADEQQRFDIADVINALCDKLIFRHPHVFGDVQADNPQQVKQNWEQIKLQEKKKKRGVLGGVPSGLPAMVKAYRISEKAASAGFDWEKKEDVWDKVKEELSEVEAEMRNPDRQEQMAEEFGDLLFSLVNAARLYGIDPELALDRCNRKFISRFNYMEALAAESGKALNAHSPGQLEEMWQQAKKADK